MTDHTPHSSPPASPTPPQGPAPKRRRYFRTLAGLVLGARLPIILTSRADSLRGRIASAALAKLVAERTRAGALAS